MYRAVIIIGTRPELVKVAPVIQEMKRRGLRKQLIIVNTGQHRELMTNTFRFLKIRADYTLDVMSPGQSLNELTAKLLVQLQELLNRLKEKGEQPKIILGQGDTCSAFVGAMTAFHNRIAFGHIEAGLRTNDLENPFPEEYYRKVIALSSCMHFAPTTSACQNLLDENIEPGKIKVTGNTAVDSIEFIRKLQSFHEPLPVKLRELSKLQNLVLVTCHRRENFGENILRIIKAVKEIAGKHPNHHFVWIRHPNPNVIKAMEAGCLHDIRNVRIIDPLDYFDLAKLLQHVKILMTDSGGLQEEAPSFKIPVVILRETTERIESVQKGFACLCGADKQKIIQAFEHFRNGISIDHNPYGDGRASIRIADWVCEFIRIRRRQKGQPGVAEEPSDVQSFSQPNAPPLPGKAENTGT